MGRAFFALFSLYLFISSINGDCVLDLTFPNPPSVSIPTCENTDNWVYSISGNEFTSTSTTGQTIFVQFDQVATIITQTDCAQNYNLPLLETRSNCNGNLCAKNGNNVTLYAAGDTPEEEFCTTCFNDAGCNVPTTPLSCEVVTNANFQSVGLGYNSGVAFAVTNKGTRTLKLQNWTPYVKATNAARTISVWSGPSSMSFSSFSTFWTKVGTSDSFNTVTAGFVSLTGIPPLEILPGVSVGILLVGSYANLINTDGDPASFDYSGQDISVVSGITTNSIESQVETGAPSTGNPVRSWFGKTTNCLYTTS